MDATTFNYLWYHHHNQNKNPTLWLDTLYNFSVQIMNLPYLRRLLLVFGISAVDLGLAVINGGCSRSAASCCIILSKVALNSWRRRSGGRPYSLSFFIEHFHSRALISFSWIFLIFLMRSSFWNKWNNNVFLNIKTKMLPIIIIMYIQGVPA